mmetsp:Transcript_11823/g.13626  ORF Transcript_11823/g.13626 Transcript_11823/m.13626 type:complete len:504 (-) Transcript_11823:1299-2810(-)|eukprot:CAMPEP_0184021290 /NCGR_PEP_ID=MMETSP0954-20121128/9840_1 /TAXON_ID=627963 /ORGANISM="Aplanochytrium sp, Strain PBS07" /LENGTH=503 /DNA_ID=CAMNT_0026303281 /DNA_START=134 /DNA_END=1645 /DNA_ORIENTATION=-
MNVLTGLRASARNRSVWLVSSAKTSVRFFSVGGNELYVQKFGGTSLGTPEKMEKVRNIVQKFHGPNRNVVAVVSALSSETKAEGTTTRLLNAAAAAVKGDKSFGDYLDKIEDTHMDVIYGLLKSKDTRESTKAYVTAELNRVRTFCESLAVIQELSPRSHDLVIGCGERLSACLLAGVLQDSGTESVMVDLSDVFQGLDTGRRGYQVEAKNAFKPLLEPLVEKNIVPVVTGFFGNISGGIIKDVGRGYTDLTSALCAGALSATQLQVWKESDGVFTGNPTKIDKAELLNLVTPAEAAELTYFGNEVLHPFTMSCAMEDEVPIAILNTFKPDGEGTRVIEASHEELSKRPGRHGITAVCSKSGIPLLNMTSRGNLEAHQYPARVFDSFSNHKVKADLISTSMSNLTVTIHESTPQESIDAVIADLEPYVHCELEMNKAIVSCIGVGMRHQTGTAASVFDCLSQGGVNIEMISQGASEINISVVIDAEDMNKAIHLIHEAFLERK